MTRKSGLGWPECVCDIGVQRCAFHPDRLMTTLQRILNEKAWDARFKASKGDLTRQG